MILIMNTKALSSLKKLKLSFLLFKISICGSTKVLPYSDNLTFPDIANLVPGKYKDFCEADECIRPKPSP